MTYRLRIYKALACPVLAYGSEAWTVKKKADRQLKAAEIMFMGRTLNCSLLKHHRNEDFSKELKLEFIIQYLH